MAIIVSIKKEEIQKTEYFPYISIVIPTYNEEKSILNRIDNLLKLDYPSDKYEIIIVDSGSIDRTQNFVTDFTHKRIKEAPRITLIVEEQRNGKASAINCAKNHSIGEIILVSDANAIFRPDALRHIGPHFIDPSVGAVGGRYCVSNTDNDLAASEAFYWDLEYVMRRGESQIDSACTFHGEINAWRKGIIDADVKMLAEDLDMCVSIRERNYRIIYEPRSIVYEPSATTEKDQIKQRKRTAIGTLQCIFKHKKFFFFPQNLYTGFIFPSHKSLPIVSPFIIILIIACSVVLNDIYMVLFSFLISVIIALFFLFFLLCLMKRMNCGKYREKINPIYSAIKIVYYVILNEYIILLAWKDYATKKYSILWEKAETTR